MKKTLQIQLSGLVQGVGFRPFVYKLAKSHQLSGWVSNRSDGVVIFLNGEPPTLQKFISALQYHKPDVAKIEGMVISEIDYNIEQGFHIRKSVQHADEVTEISPDLAVCQDCLQDMDSQLHRMDYPFINCTHCGPRFSIVKGIPYDRCNTTMDVFEMCNSCKREYDNVDDRRFHAQPIACIHCGPHYELFSRQRRIANFSAILNDTATVINRGGIASIKGLGGFFIACDALNENAVKHLRKSKNRYGKPFAVMFSSIDDVKNYAFVNAKEEALLTSIRRPVVLLKLKFNLSASVCGGLNTVGAMLPYMPIHYQLFDKLNTRSIVLTSGNISEEPIAIEEHEAINKLGKFSDVVVGNNRPIYNRVDDSVLFVAGGEERFIRRSRGYVPQPVKVGVDVDGILATGAELANCFGIGKHHQVIMSQHIGDLKNADTYSFYLESLEHFKRIFRFTPKLVVSDLHPDYLSTTFAETLNIPHIKVQHHHAHIASCMAEHGLDQHVLGVSMDGTGYGTDGKIWGGEFLLCDLKQFDRLYHFEYIPIPGGDMAIKQPWRTAFSYLYHYFGEAVFDLNLPKLVGLEQKELLLIKSAIDRKINCPESSSAGRLFDAMAAMLNICRIAQYHAEAPMRLESCINPDIRSNYAYALNGTVVSFKPMFEGVLSDLNNKVDAGTIATRFHNTLIKLIKEIANKIRDHLGITKVVLSGGTFQNKYLLEFALHELQNAGFQCFANARVPSNDGGIALGQMLIGAKKRMMQCV